MFAFVQSYPLLLGITLIVFDLTLWQLIPANRRPWRIGARLLAFSLFTWVLISAGVSPLQPAPWVEDVPRNLLATVLGIAWWLFAARTATVVIGLVLVARSGHTGRLLQDVLGAVIFLVAIVAAAAYVLQLPVKGLLATSGVMAIVIGLALQSTLSDVFSGIVLNTTRPYQIGDSISIDGTEGKVIEIDWRATRLLTGNGSMAVIPNSVAAKAKLLNFSQPSDVHGVSISVVVPAKVRPRRVLDALEKTLQGTRTLLTSPAPKATIKSSSLESVEYEASGFVGSMSQKTEVRNHMFDLAHRHLEAAGVVWNSDTQQGQVWNRQRALLEDVRIFRSLSNEEKDNLSQRMTAVEYLADQVILGVGDSSDYLLVIGTGVVSVGIRDGDKQLEAGRMGPGEVLGVEGLLEAEDSTAEFRTLTSCILYRIDKDEVRSCLEQRTEVKTALIKLQRIRQQTRQSLLEQKPAAIKKGGFLSWLHK
ncbi:MULTISPECIES: mechanosensitive ion channel family protein [Pseudomonas]|uniref:Small-conductance mechanosensitive channel n=1 Tax=Pseudomonas donghuensis TaxID=1163398 RepID=A0AAP0XAJ7_9PSED|nr:MULTISPECIES: mechanosensitive ion channel family protein [Pseudomonas]MDF9896055.1 small-conductance mechanosensitive channel [Pseudomonas vranovensis]KDO00458.1 mechanosensitive ion channel family protein [Pseudomonas donghuensis]MBS7598476.1 mechanosensitive ion channel family protein [Pseudomonas sp. RC2C2]MCP6690167.1 mechanosensitive ion channel family protein [Pseudomonas donghuensis]QHF30951.1 mechanosensitive ion channel protein MscS [Pseudomonas sp. R32]